MFLLFVIIQGASSTLKPSILLPFLLLFCVFFIGKNNKLQPTTLLFVGLCSVFLFQFCLAADDCNVLYITYPNTNVIVQVCSIVVL